MIYPHVMTMIVRVGAVAVLEVRGGLGAALRDMCALARLIGAGETQANKEWSAPRVGVDRLLFEGLPGCDLS